MLRPPVIRAGLVTLGLALLAGCSGSGSGDGGVPPGGSNCASGQEFASTFEGIQKVVFEKRGCTQQVCHGSSAQGGLDLSSAVAWENLVERPATGSPFQRVYPGDKDRSWLWLKLLAASQPGSVQITGSPMPLGLEPLSADELDAVRLWILAGAPKTGAVMGTETLLDACLPPAEPITIKPLDPPPAGEGVQFVLPEFPLAAKSEVELCYAQYYDFSDQVPSEFRDPTGQYFRFSGQELRQDPQSHHLILNLASVTVDQLHDPAFGEWTCKGGARAGQTCEPTDTTFCGEGGCASVASRIPGCVGFGPRGTNGPFPNTDSFAIGGAQKAQARAEFVPGVFGQVPIRGVVYWNPHAFNLTNSDTMMRGRINFTFAKQQTWPVRPIFDDRFIFHPATPPFTSETICRDFELPRGARLFSLSSHTHKRGKHFTVDGPNGRLYESSVYNDPVVQRFDPPLLFDAADPAGRTLHYCSLFENGVDANGAPDPATVTRRSVTPPNAIGPCRPVACAAGRIGAACAGPDDHATCDTSPGAGDGSCDACRILGGVSTENEMFILIGQYYVEGDPSPGGVTPGGIASASADGAPRGHSSGGRSTFTGLAVPPQMGCGSSHSAHGEGGGHAAHLGH